MKNLVVLAMMVMSSAAAADTYKDFTFTAPSGWGPYPGRCRGACFLDETTKARIDVYSIGAASPAAATKTVVANPTKSQSLAVGGRAGAFAMGAGKVVAAATMGSEVLVIALETPSAVQSDLAAWAAIVDGGSFAGTPAAPPTYDPPEERRYTIKLVNIGTGCTAKMSWDGTAYELNPGETRQIETSAGDHDMTFTNNDGTTGSGRYNVPKNGTFKTGCVTPKQDTPRPPPATTQQPPAADDTVKALASWALLVVGHQYKWQSISNGVGMSTSYTFWTTGDDVCPIAFTYVGLATGVTTIQQQINGCAFIDSIVAGAPAGTTQWRFHATYGDLPGRGFKGAMNEDIWAGKMRIYTDAIDLMDHPFGVFDLNKGDAYRLFKQ